MVQNRAYVSFVINFDASIDICPIWLVYYHSGRRVTENDMILTREKLMLVVIFQGSLGILLIESPSMKISYFSKKLWKSFKPQMCFG